MTESVLVGKQCNTCKETKPLSGFYAWGKGRKSLMPYCKVCHQNRQQKHRASLGENYNKSYRLHRAKKKIKAVELFGNVCLDCKNSFPLVCYDFHHLDPSQKDISIGELLHKSWKHVENELSKCIMLCSNCHRIRHASQENLYKTSVSKSEG